MKQWRKDIHIYAARGPTSREGAQCRIVKRAKMIEYRRETSVKRGRETTTATDDVSRDPNCAEPGLSILVMRQTLGNLSPKSNPLTSWNRTNTSL